MECMILDWLSWLRFSGLSRGDRTPGDNSIRHFQGRLPKAGTLCQVMRAFDWKLQKKG